MSRMNVRPRSKPKIACPKCGDDQSQVIDGRMPKGLDGYRRRRHCLGCAYTYYTLERVERIGKPANRKKLAS